MVLLDLLVLMASLALAAWHIRARRFAEQAGAAADARAAGLLRLVRLNAAELRSTALGLLGQGEASSPTQLPPTSFPDDSADDLVTLAPPVATQPSLARAARQLLKLSDDLLAQTDDEVATRHLRPEKLALLPLLDFALARVAGQLSPGRRAWQVAPTLSHIILVADRRALNQILTAVLTNAAAGTSEGDWIELTAEQDSENWSLCIQDEGVGLDLAAPPAPPTGETWRVSDTRGIGPGLALSASLMRAHGGALRVEAAMRIGTRVRLSFPKTRLLT